MTVSIRPRIDGAIAPSPAPSSFPLAAALEARQADIEALLPQGVEFKRVIAELFLAWRRNPAIAKVPVDKLIVAVGRALATGGVLDQDVYIVPFGNDAVAITDYKYKAEMVIAAGGARSIEVRAVWDKEPFEIHYGTDARIVHQPLDGHARGKKLRGAYAIARIRADIIKFEWLDIEDIETIRAKSQQWGPGKLRECPAWYAKKSAVHQLVKLLPKSPRLRAIAQMIQDEEAVEFDVQPARIEAGDDDVGSPTDISDLQEEREPGDEDSDHDVTLLEASECRVNGKPLSSIRNTGIRAVKEWAEGKLDADGPDVRLGWILACCDKMLDAREKGEAVEPAKADKPKKGVEPWDDAGNGSMDLGDQPARRSKSAIAEGR